MPTQAIRAVVFIVEAPFTERDRRRFGVDLLTERGFSVGIWDLAPLIHPGDRAQGAGVARMFRDRFEAVAALSGLGADTLAVTLLGFKPRALPYYAALSRGRAPFAVFLANALPLLAEPSLRDGAVRALKEKLFAAASAVGCLRPASLCLASGEGSFLRCVLPATSRSEVLWAHALDYDVYLSLKSAGETDPEPGAGVFLDEYMPFHPDYAYQGQAAYASAERYFPALRAFFDRLEKDHGAHVTVAAHPHSRYEGHPEYFGGRRVARGETAAIVQRSAFVVAHASTSVNFAVLFGRPILFVTTDEIAASPQGPLVERMARLLGKKALNLDRPDPIDWEAEMTVDRAAYDAYVHAYIKSPGSPQRPFWAIVADRLEKGPVP